MIIYTKICSLKSDKPDDTTAVPVKIPSISWRGPKCNVMLSCISQTALPRASKHWGISAPHVSLSFWLLARSKSWNGKEPLPPAHMVEFSLLTCAVLRAPRSPFEWSETRDLAVDTLKHSSPTDLNHHRFDYPTFSYSPDCEFIDRSWNQLSIPMPSCFKWSKQVF